MPYKHIIPETSGAIIEEINDTEDAVLASNVILATIDTAVDTANGKLDTLHTDLGTTIHTDLATTIHTDLATTLHTDLNTTIHTDLATTIHTDLATTLNNSINALHDEYTSILLNGVTSATAADAIDLIAYDQNTVAIKVTATPTVNVVVSIYGDRTASKALALPIFTKTYIAADLDTISFDGTYYRYIWAETTSHSAGTVSVYAWGRF